MENPSKYSHAPVNPALARRPSALTGVADDLDKSLDRIVSTLCLVVQDYEASIKNGPSVVAGTPALAQHLQEEYERFNSLCDDAIARCSLKKCADGGN